MHTPPDHYKHDHAFVLEEARRFGPGCRLLDVGCGTGVLLEKAVGVGIEARGIDASKQMIDCARARGLELVRLQAMEELDAVSSYNLIVALSWTLNYARTEQSLHEILRRMHRALINGGRVLLQVAHAENATGDVLSDPDWQAPHGPSDPLFLYRFHRALEPTILYADYVFASKLHQELVFERHELAFANARHIAAELVRAGFDTPQIFNSWRRDPHTDSIAPFVVADRLDLTPVEA